MFCMKGMLLIFHASATEGKRPQRFFLEKREVPSSRRVNVSR